MAEDLNGKLIDRKYRLLSELGRGAMGIVYRAEQLDAEGRVRRIVAVKTLKPEFSKDPDFARRFLREVGVSMQLRNPHALTVYDSGRDESGQLYYVMEFMPQTLKEYLQERSPLPVEHAVAIVGQICDALAEAHNLPEPVVHRDIKPANIFIEQRQGREVIKIGDFGIAKVLNEHTTVLTHTGQASPGTPRYMAPEQWLGQAIDGRTDLYSVGIMLYEMLNGQPPFSGPIPVLMGQHLQLPPPPLAEAIPVGVRKEIEHLLAKKPEERPPDASSVRGMLETALKDKEEEQRTLILQKNQEQHAVIEQPVATSSAERAEAEKQPIILLPQGNRLSPQEIEDLFRLRDDRNRQDEDSTVVQVPIPLIPGVITNTFGMEFVLIDAGAFFTGSKNGRADEKPLRRVRISKRFYLGRYPITQAQWKAVMGNNPSLFKGDPECPVENVSWDDAQEFLQKLSVPKRGKIYLHGPSGEQEEREFFRKLHEGRLGGLYRLPTEAEWEYACRAGSMGAYSLAYSFGDDEAQLKEYAWYKENSGGTPHPVGKLKPNAWGLYDMHGNVWEWMQDRYAEDYYRQRLNLDVDPQGFNTKTFRKVWERMRGWYAKDDDRRWLNLEVDPQGPDTGTLRVVRGGSFFQDGGRARCASRYGHSPLDHGSGGGFRIVVEPVVL